MNSAPEGAIEIRKLRATAIAQATNHAGANTEAGIQDMPKAVVNVIRF